MPTSLPTPTPRKTLVQRLALFAKGLFAKAARLFRKRQKPSVAQQQFQQAMLPPQKNTKRPRNRANVVRRVIASIGTGAKRAASRLRRGAKSAPPAQAAEGPERRGLHFPRSRRLTAVLVAGTFFVALLMSTIMRSTVFARSFVTIHFDGTVVTLATRADTVGEVLEEANIQFFIKDQVYPAPETPIGDEMAIHIARAGQVWLTYDDTRQTVTVALNQTVGELLAAQNVQVSPLDLVTPSPETPLEGGMLVAITRITHREEHAYSPIPYAVLVRDDETMLEGEWLTIEPGVDGRMVHVLEETLYNGEVVDCHELSRAIDLEPVDRVVLRGVREPTPSPTPPPTPTPTPTRATTTPRPSASSSRPRTATPKPSAVATPNPPTAQPNTGSQTITINGVQYRYKSAVSSRVTAYTHTGRNTATGTWPAHGTLGVQPKKIPYGTRVYIPGYGIGVGRDTGSTSFQNLDYYWIDCFMETEAECIQWGMQQLTVYILE